MIRRWEIVDTRDGEQIGYRSRYFTRRGAERWRRRLNHWLRYRPGYELRVQRRERVGR